MKKSGVVWVGVTGRPQPIGLWHAWIESRTYLLIGPGEQPDPGLVEGETLTVTAPGKDSGRRLVSWVGVASAVSPDDRDWESATTALAKGRLNLHEPWHAPQRWAADPAIVVWRIMPTGQLVEGPGTYRTDDTFATPLPSPATTVAPLPVVTRIRRYARRRRPRILTHALGRFTTRCRRGHRS